MVVVFVVASETLKKQMVKRVNNIYRELGSWARGCRSRLPPSWHGIPDIMITFYNNNDSFYGAECLSAQG